MKDNRWNIPVPETLEDIALLFHTDSHQIQEFLNHLTVYYRWQKRLIGNKERSLCQAAPPLKAFHQEIDSWLRNFPPHPCAHGWQRGRSTITCAEAHIAQEVLIRIDIKDFFPSISFTRVLGTLRELGCGEEAAFVLTKLLTVDNQLPQGFVPSPHLANLILKRFDGRILGFCRKHDYQYGRFGDDLNLSGSASKHQQIIMWVRRLITESGFSVNEEKFARQGVRFASQQQLMLGMTVNVKRNLPKNQRRAYLQMVTAAKVPGDFGSDSGPVSANQIEGCIGYAQQISPRFGRRLRALWQQ